MPKKITKKMKEEMVRLRDEEELPWGEVGEKVGVSENTARKYYEKEKNFQSEEEGEEEDTQLSAKVFQMFDRKKSPVELVKEGIAKPEKIKELWEKFKELNKEEIEKEKDTSYHNGYNKGYEDAKEEYRITYPCTVCGEPVTMTPGDKSHREVKECLKNWGHESCIDEDQPSYSFSAI